VGSLFFNYYYTTKFTADYAVKELCKLSQYMAKLQATGWCTVSCSPCHQVPTDVWQAANAVKPARILYSIFQYARIDTNIKLM